MIQKIKRTTTGVDKVNNALVENGGYRMTVSHSNLTLEDENGIVVQRPLVEDSADARANNQLWVLEQSETRRHYTLQNFGTGRYYCPPTELLDTVKTSTDACEIRIENASVNKGYYLYGDYDSDFVGDVLNISKDSGMPVITWVRTGTDNQKFKLEKAALPDTTSADSSMTSIRAGELRNRVDLRLPKQKYRDLKGRRYDKQIPYRVMF